MLERVRSIRALAWGAVSLATIFLLIEFFDELHYGIEGAALPAIRLDLGLTYAQIGLLLGLPHLIGTLVEPVLMLLGDTHLRKQLIIGGGLVIVFSLLMIGSAQGFGMLLAASVLSFPASGAFVTLAQATLMDLNPGREPQMMARWTVAGSLGDLIGPLLLAAGFSLALGWRWAFFGLALLAAALAAAVYFKPFPRRSQLDSSSERAEDKVQLRQLVDFLREALHNRRLMRWIILLQLSDLLLDIFIGYAPLYLTDVVGATPAQASLLFTLMMLATLASDVVLIPLLEKVPGRQVVRISAWISAAIYVSALLVPYPVIKIVLLIALRFSTMGWYQVLQGEAYAAAPGRSGTVSAISSVAGALGGIFAWAVGYAAGIAGLPAAMWLLLLGPLSLALFVPRPDKTP